MQKFKRVALKLLIALAILYLILLIPSPGNNPVATAANQPAFTWNQDSLWSQLENKFIAARSMPKEALDAAILQLKKEAYEQYGLISGRLLAPNDQPLKTIQGQVFQLAPLVAAAPSNITWYTSYYDSIRNYIKFTSFTWDTNELQVRNKIYEMLYGMRAAIEEVILQADSNFLPAARMVNNEYSVTPAASIVGIPVHSGDILVSRGGAEVSALISRGNDYPGNFSHIAFLYVDEKTKKPWLIESHIEKGVAIADVEQYIKDKKLRFMVMRPKAALYAMGNDPMLPHKAAKAMYEESLSRHIPYDFKMDFRDSVKMFCSEVASYSYRKKGVQLWQQLSTISSPGVVKWLGDFGVENFITQMPSDLEYDPQLSVVAEWRDPETLYKDHIDNAVMDAMLEQANKGQSIGYDHWQLPFVRIVKAYCVVKNWFGATGIIPEGMSATAALKNQRFVAMNKAINTKVQQMAADFTAKNHYRPPYWQLVRFAQAAANDQ